MSLSFIRRMTTTVTSTMSATKAASTGSALRVNGARLMDSIHGTCEIGKAHPYGE